jgi:8-amino-7-oxononanoate synthase
MDCAVVAPVPAALAHLREDLEALRSQGLLRDDRAPRGKGISFCSNDYLGLGERAASPARAGAGASRLIDGDTPEHRALEQSLAEWLGADAALLFSSGYAANVGALAALVRPGDLVVSDELNHASIIDGVRLSRGDVRIVPHLDAAAIANALSSPRTGRAWVVTESYFSMDADGPDLRELRRICDDAGAALFVDEAHALGALGPEGRGRCAEAGVVPDVLVGTLGKALGAGGAFVAGCSELRAWLWNRSRSFVFSTGLPPATAATALMHLQHIQRTPELRERLARTARLLRQGFHERGHHAPGFGHIVPWFLSAPDAALRAAAGLRELGIRVLAIRPPTVPNGTARVRLAASAIHTDADIEALFRALDQVDKACSLRSSS